MILMHNEIEKHKNNNLIKGHPDDMGYDIRSGQDIVIPVGGSKEIYTGLHINMPKYLGMVIQSRSGLAFHHRVECSRSGIALHHRVECSNAGVIDCGYNDSINLLLYNHGQSSFQIKKGQRVAQAIFHIRPEGFFSYFSEMLSRFRIMRFSITEKDIKDWPETARGNNGFGSTGV